MKTQEVSKTTKDLKPFTRKEMADLYSVSIRTFNTWIKPHQQLIGRINGWYFTLAQVRLIFKVLGEPNGFENIED